MAIPGSGAKGPGQGRGGRPEGFSFGDDKKGGRDRGDRRGGPGGRDRKGGGGASFRVVNELSTLEKALTKSDFENERAPLQEVLKALKPMHLKSLEDLDFNTRGKLITSLARVQRQAKPKPSEAPATEAAPAPEAPAEAAPAPEVAPAPESAPASEAAPATDAPAPEAAAAPAAPAEARPATPAVDPKVQAYGDVLFTVGLIWRSVGDTDRASSAFELAGRQPTAADLAVPPREERPAAPARGERPGKGGPRGERRDRQERPERPQHKTEMFVSSGDWQADAKKLEELGRTRDAARVHEKNKSYLAASTLFENGGDLGSALRTAALAQDAGRLETLAPKFDPTALVKALEKAEAWTLLMSWHVKHENYEAVARLYERARQFDQAGAAYERAQKLSLARKAYERAKDQAGVARVRDLEVQKLIERGDCYGAATLLLGADKKAEALEALKSLPPTKAFHFMEKLKLADEAKALATEELAKAEAAANKGHAARWYELLGEKEKAVEAYLAADRKDKASFVLESMGQFQKAAELAEASRNLDKAQELFQKAGDTANAERVKALPRPEPKPKPKAPVEADAASELPAAAVVDSPKPSAPTAQA